MTFQPYQTGDSTSASIACFILKMPRVDWFKQSVVAALSTLAHMENWTPQGALTLEEAAEIGAQMVEELIVTNFDPLPIGRIEMFAGPTVPDGYLICDGETFLTSEFPELFEVIGYTWGGSGDSFVVPDLVNRFPVGNQGIYELAELGGEQTVLLTEDTIPTHNHVASGTAVVDLGHSHGYSSAFGTITSISPGAPQPTAVPAPSTTAPASANLQVTDPDISNYGNSQAHNNVPPYAGLWFIIYAGR
jgi:microcystin-dependent protein